MFDTDIINTIPLIVQPRLTFRDKRVLRLRKIEIGRTMR